MKRINVLIFGSGGREHALAWKLMQSPQAGTIYVMPGNPGTAMMGCQNVPIEPTFANLGIIRTFVRNRQIGLIVIQLDNALAEGLVNYLHDLDVVIFGPTRSAAQIEWSKSYAKEIMAAAGIPTAPFRIFRKSEMTEAAEYVKASRRPLVVKADGLALGKGVRVCNDQDAAFDAIEDCFVREKFGAAGHTIVIEDKLEGVELSVHAFCDGDNAIMLPPLRDHKRLNEDPDSPMTGGMGVYGPIDIDLELHRKIAYDIIKPCIQELRRRETPFRGCLYPGIMLTEYGPKVLEFNARFGDPETQVYMRMLADDVDLIDVFKKSVEGKLPDAVIEWRNCKAACIIAAAAGYPDNPRKGDLIILNLPYEGEYDPIAFHAGTAWKKGALVTSGSGRVLGVTTLIPKDKGVSWAYEPFGRAKVCFKDMQYRKDIGAVS